MSDDVLSIGYGERDGSTVVELRGRLDSETSPRFQNEVVGRCAGKDVILDMAGLKYISSEFFAHYDPMLNPIPNKSMKKVRDMRR